VPTQICFLWGSKSTAILWGQNANGNIWIKIINRFWLCEKWVWNIGITGIVVNGDLFDSLERLHCRAARIIFNLPKDMRSSDVLEYANWHPLSYCYKLALFKLMQKAFSNRLAQVICDTIATKLAPGHSLRALKHANSATL